jgi:hypothetical protein
MVACRRCGALITFRELQNGGWAALDLHMLDHWERCGAPLKDSRLLPEVADQVGDGTKNVRAAI